MPFIRRRTADRRRLGSGDVVTDRDITAHDIVTGTQIVQIFQLYASIGGTASADHFDRAVTEYLRWLESNVNHIFMRGMKRNDGAAAELPLDRVFTALPVEAQVEIDLIPPAVPAYSNGPDAASARPFSQIQITTAPPLHPFGPRMALIGKPGSGKTTLLHYIALCLARALLYQKPELASSILGPAKQIPLPIVVPLALYGEHRVRFARSADPRDRQLATFVSHYLIERQAGLDLPGDFFSVLLQRGARIMLLLDGLDEVRTPQLRGVVAQAVRDLVTTRPELHCVLSSRPHCYDDEVTVGAGFCTLRLLPVTSKKAGELIDKMSQALPALSDVSIRGQSAESLKDRMAAIERASTRSQVDMDRVFDTPLMVRLAFVAEHNGLPFSMNRAQLYASTVDALLTGSYNPDELVNAFLTQGAMTWLRYRELLQYVAFELHSRTNDRSVVLDEATLVSLLRRYMTHELHMSGEIVSQLLEAFIATTTERGSVLAARGGVFLLREHRLQEFLAARYIAERIREIDKIAEFMEEPSRAISYWWREVFMLAIGYLGISTPDTQLTLLLRLAGLTEKGSASTPSVRALATTELAADAMIEYGCEDPSHLKGVTNRLATLLFDTRIGLEAGHVTDVSLRIKAGDTLGYLGDPRPGVDPAAAPVSGCRSGVFCEVPAGGFVLGTDRQQDGRAFPQEFNMTRAELTYSYFVARYPVTTAQFRLFEQDSDGYDNDANWTEAGLEWRRRNGDRTRQLRVAKGPNHPVTEVTWYESQAYCTWLRGIILEDNRIMVWSEAGIENRSLRPFVVRLPTEQEWEKAARGTDGRWYSWGNRIEAPVAVRRRVALSRPTPVGIFVDEDSPYGAVDMCGNVWEWCQDPWRSSITPQQSPGLVLALPEDRRAVRGGGFGPDQRMLRAACRFGNLPGENHDDLGFRPVILPAKDKLRSLSKMLELTVIECGLAT
jgi:formylglycine-generating enzyme required for sulfatase activity